MIRPTLTRAEVIRLAHEASPDMTWYEATVDETTAAPDELAFLERFAALVAAAEREECAKACEVNHGTIRRNLDSFQCAAAIRARSP